MKRIASGSPQAAECFLEGNMMGAEMIGFAGGQAAVFSARSPEKSTPSEDAAALIPFGERAGVLVVADGLGGQPAGEKAAQLAIEQLQGSLAAAWTARAELRDAILNGFEAANRSICQNCAGSAATLAVVEIQQRTIRPYHAGDSMVLAVGQRGKIKLQTVPHSPVGYAVEAGFLDADEAMHHDERHLISNMIGTSDMHITIGSTLALADRDTLVVASDGLSDNLTTDEIIGRVRKGALPVVAEHLLRAATERMQASGGDRPCKPDDLTFIVYRPLEPSPPTDSGRPRME